MNDLSDWDRIRGERRCLRNRQRGLTKRFVKDIGAISVEDWRYYSHKFRENLALDAELDPEWIDPERYLLALYSLFTALGFTVHAGPIPRVSGIQEKYFIPLLAYDDTRAVLIERHPSSLFADLADIQPLCPMPILGLSYKGIVSARDNPASSEYALKSLIEAKRLAAALAVGHLNFSFSELQEALVVSPFEERDKVIDLARRIGLISFLAPPVDSLPIFGEHVSANHEMPYNPEEFIKDAERTESAGARMASGDVTQATPEEACQDPEYFFKQLRKTRMLGRGSGQDIKPTSNGWAYLRSKVLPFPLGQLLRFTCLAARQEIREVAKTAFVDALRSGGTSPQLDDMTLFVPIDDLDSFSRINQIPPSAAEGALPLRHSEQSIKSFLQNVLGDQFVQKDWGGEQNDIFTTNLVYRGNRCLAAFMLKGPSVKGKLTIARCGKNGDQLQRLFQSPADVFVVQFNGEIDQRVIEECRQKTAYNRATGRPHAIFTLIDGVDTSRLLLAYRDKAPETVVTSSTRGNQELNSPNKG